MAFERRILAKNSDRRQTSSDVKPGRVGLVIGWVTTFKQKLCCADLILAKRVSDWVVSVMPMSRRRMQISVRDFFNILIYSIYMLFVWRARPGEGSLLLLMTDVSTT